MLEGEKKKLRVCIGGGPEIHDHHCAAEGFGKGARNKVSDRLPLRVAKICSRIGGGAKKAG